MAVAFKNEQIYLKLRSEILSGKLADGCRLPPEEQLARELNIGRVTLRAALKRLEDESFIRRVRGQGTFVAYDGNLTDADSGQSADFYKLPAVQHITHKFLLLFSKKTYRTSSIMICSAVQKRAAEKGVEVVSMDYEFFRNCIAMKRGDELIKKSGITGIILPFHGFIGDEPDLVFFRNLKIPVVLPLPWDSDIYLGIFAAFDSPIRPAMYAALRWLRSMGHKNVAFAGPQGSGNIHLLSEQEYRSMTSSSGELFITAPPDIPLIKKALSDYLNRHKPTALFCYDKDYALAALETCRELNIRIPEDLSLINFSISDDFTFSDPVIAYNDLKLKERGRSAVDYLLAGGREPLPEIGFSLIKTNSVADIKQS